MRIDKTYSELWNLVNAHEDTTVQETAKMAINTLQKLQKEIEKLEKSYEESLVKSSNRLEKLIEIQHILDK